MIWHHTRFTVWDLETEYFQTTVPCDLVVQDRATNTEIQDVTKFQLYTYTGTIYQAAKSLDLTTC